MLAIGLMSGTSLDGIDAALIETDGEGLVRPRAFLTEAYTAEQRAQLVEATAHALTFKRPRADPLIDAAAAMLTDAHLALVRRLMREADIVPSEVAVVGFHGQTVAHRPDRGWTWQIGDGAAMAPALGIPVVDDFRSADVIAGGQGAPLIPVYHRVMAERLERPAAILNLGGVGNLTWIGADGELVAFDTGPGNGPIDDWAAEHLGRPCDEDGRAAAAGRVDTDVLARMLDKPWFALPPPKSLDRADFSALPAEGLSAEDGAATLTAFTAETIRLALRHCPERPRALLVAGGGRRNPTLMGMIAKACNVAVRPIEAEGWNGDATEAEGFAYMAVRTLMGLAISFPGTTGAPRAMPGGVLHRPD